MKRGIVQFINMFIPTVKNESKGIYLYGQNNLLPNEWLKFISDSGVAARCAEKVSEYIAADGFIDKTVAEKKANERQNFNDLLQDASQYFGSLTACGFHISRDSSGKVISVKVVPYQCIRRKINGDFEVNLTYGQPKFEKDASKTYKPFYGTLLPVEKLKDYKDGEIAVVFKKTPINPYYAFPTYYAGIEDIKTSSELAKMDLELSLNGFMPSAMITMVGDVDDVNKDEDGKTELDIVAENFRQFTGQVKDPNGGSGRFKAWLTFAKTADEVPKLQTLDVKSILDASNAKREVIERSVCRLFGVHPVLVGYSDASVLGNTQAISNASLELTNLAGQYQKMISSFLEKCYPNFDFTITEYTPIQYVDPALMADMTQDERRQKFLGLPPLNNGTIQQN